MTAGADWRGRVGRIWAEHWQRTDRSFGTLTERLLHYTRALNFMNVLDVGCGAGEVSVALARSHGHARIQGIDLSEDLIEVAQARGEHYANLSFRAMDATLWEDPTMAPDLLVSRHGVMFFANPTGAFNHLSNHAAPGAALVFTCFRARSENHWATELDQLVGNEPGPASIREPGPFSFGNREEVERMLLDAGWSEPQFEPLDYAMVAGSGENAVEEARAYFLRIGPAAGAIAELSGSEHSDAVARLEQMLRYHEVDGLVAMGAAAWIVTARKPL
ncbi:class I SAM-dependent methyltransferase [Alteriqipengyuania flavescens]|uniref:class I SAM-dependent methyltransferase n=1 Tax=Alteriqipengyuania flavescens TaxID=3053610 RepID=UPI0025B35778|nr:class I SAM-dependent methyltransferase [Alteriqipengyuania flavescens]WJY18008.1 class I SAM-dependent methyltransferase [Alteriqipengyuania flavescens]WJY23949.1 class I SAM-dependent methyltransferase [Alteriqipengyuania flavescens]